MKVAKRVVIRKAGGISCISAVPMEIPSPGVGEVRVKVAYAGINFADLLMRMGFYNPRPPYPFTPGYEVSGVVDAVGEGVEGWTVGQRVVAAMRNGGQASYVLAPSERVIALPDGFSLESAAATPVTYLTAHHMLHHLGHMTSEDSVLIHGARVVWGRLPCSCAAGQALRRSGQPPPNKSITFWKGMVRAIDRHNEDFASIIKQETNGRGVDHILDPIGGDHLRRSLSSLAEGGRLYTYGLSAAAPTSKRSLLKAIFALRKSPKFDPLRLMTRNRGVFGVHMGTWTDEKVMRQQLQRIIEGIQSGHLEPIIDSVFPAEEVQAAHQHIHDAKNIGKVLLKFENVDDKKKA